MFQKSLDFAKVMWYCVVLTGGAIYGKHYKRAVARQHLPQHRMPRSNEKAMFTHLLEKRMEIYPDAMNINRVAKITGYSRTTILRRVQNGDMFAVMMNDEYVLSKAGVIEFFASDKGFAMQPKSEWHEKAIKWFVKEMYKTT